MREIFSARLDEMGIPGWLVPDYTPLLVGSVVAALILTVHLWRGAGRSATEALWLLAVSGPCMTVGARFFYLLQYGFPDRLSAWFADGMSLYGGLIGLLAAWVLARVLSRFPLMMFLDTVTPALALGLGITRFGCLMHGCNGGTPCLLPWAMSFPRTTSVFHHQMKVGLVPAWASSSLPVHPTQLYESLFSFGSLILLLRLYPRKDWHGQIFLTGALWYPIYRFASEYLRADAGGWHPFGFTFAQVTSLVVFLAAALAYLAFAFPIFGFLIQRSFANLKRGFC